jgi:catechol 2,3-dioxygenase-like lactoylglutathione lyase family enzyme
VREAISRHCAVIGWATALGSPADIRWEVLPLLLERGRGDREAMSRLYAAGAKPPKPVDASGFQAGMAEMAGSVKKLIPMIHVSDVAATLDWYKSIGFQEIGRYEDGGLINWGMLSFGNGELMLAVHENPGPHDVSLWFYTDRIDLLYHLLKSRQIEAMRAILAGAPGPHEGIEFVEDLNDPFYGGRQLGIRDLNGFTLYFLQPAGSEKPE